MAESIYLVLDKKDSYDYFPEQTFNGSLLLDERPLSTFFGAHKKDLKKVDKHSVCGSISINETNVYFQINEDDEKILGVQLSRFIPPPPKVYSDKYNFKPIAGEKIEFADFNFKLAVIQVLMYEKELLKPKFDIHDFIENYAKREIDVEKEGYGFIPEVTEYFEQLEIDKKLASQITEIIQEGGDAIYQQLYYFWDGEGDEFNIESLEDIKHFKNLKKMSLFYSKREDEFRKVLQANGIKLE